MHIVDEGLPNTSGVLIRGHVTSTADADVVACMRKAGAIPLVVTNCSELCMWMESSNFVYGRTNSAYHRGRIVGGSSGNILILVDWNSRRCVAIFPCFY